MIDIRKAEQKTNKRFQIGYENEDSLGKEELLEKKKEIKTEIAGEQPKGEIEKKLLVEDPSANPEAKIELKMVEKETKKPSKKEEMVVPDVVQLFQSPEV